MTYRPKKNSRKASGLALAAAIVSVLCFCCSPYLPAPVVYQLAGLVLAVVALQIYMKFVQSDYEYRVTANDLEIYKLTGKKSMPVCSVALSESVTGVMSADYAAKHTNALPRHAISLNFCKNILSEDYALYFFNFNGKIARLKFEPDEAFASCVNKYIAAAKDPSPAEDKE